MCLHEPSTASGHTADETMGGVLLDHLRNQDHVIRQCLLHHSCSRCTNGEADWLRFGSGEDAGPLHSNNMLLDADTRQNPLPQDTLWQSVDLIHVAARVGVPLAATWMSFWHSRDILPYTITGPPPSWSFMREDVAGNRMFSTASPDSHLNTIPTCSCLCRSLTVVILRWTPQSSSNSSSRTSQWQSCSPTQTRRATSCSGGFVDLHISTSIWMIFVFPEHKSL